MTAHRYIYLLLCLLLAMPLGAQKAKKGTKTTQKAKPVKVDKKKQLQQQKAEAERQRKLQQQKAQQLNKNIRTNLDSLLILDHQITRQGKSIDSLNGEMGAMQLRIDTLEAQLKLLQKQLEQRKTRYAHALQQQRRAKSIQQRLTFIFSADNFSQLIRRMRYMREYITYQRAQGQLLKEKQAEVTQTHNQLLDARATMQVNLNKMEQKKKTLQGMKSSCQSKADFLNKNLANVQQQIAEYQKKEQALSAQIDKLIQEEIEAERRRRAEAEARRKAAEAEAKRKAAEAEAKKKAQKSQKNQSNQKTRNNRNKQNTQNNQSPSPAPLLSYSTDSKLTSGFANNKGRLPMPVTGGYSIVGHYGRYSPIGLPGVVLVNKGIDIRAGAGASARAIFDGEVSNVFQYGSTYIVMLRHGSYISVYSGLRSVNIRKGQKVKTRETLGSIGTDSDGNYTLHFQLRRESQELNPELWVR